MEEGCYFEEETAHHGHCLAHLNALQDVIGGTFQDAVFQERRSEDEIGALIQMIKRSPFDSKTIYIADRGYEAYNLIAHIQERGQFYGNIQSAWRAFTQKKAEFIRQEIFARLILFNFCQLVVSHAAIFKKSGHGSCIFQINFSFAVGACRSLLFLTSDDPPPDTISLLLRFLLPVRPHRLFPRAASRRKPLFFCYRVA